MIWRADNQPADGGSRFHMTKKKIYRIILLLLIPILLLIGFGFYKTLSYGLDGTYSAGNEPDNKNIYMVLKNQEFTVYNQYEILDSGVMKEVHSNHTFEIFELFSKDSTRAGYVIHNKNHIVLLDFQDMNESLEKISNHAIYLGYESE
ncbi:MAG: hypothetical protein J6B28_07820 [Eubacterium sp.]|nr:hypothetical protein [Eubacterium sp.]